MSCFASAIMNSSLMVFGFLYPNTLFRYYLEPNAVKRVKMTIPSLEDVKTCARYADSRFLVMHYFFGVAIGSLE